MVGGFGEGLVRVVRHDQAPDRASESNVLGRPILPLQFGHTLVVYSAGRAWHGETIAIASSAPQGRRGEAAQPDGRMGLLDRFGRYPDIVEVEEFALKGDCLTAEKPTNDFE